MSAIQIVLLAALIVGPGLLSGQSGVRSQPNGQSSARLSFPAGTVTSSDRETHKRYGKSKYYNKIRLAAMSVVYDITRKN